MIFDDCSLNFAQVKGKVASHITRHKNGKYPYTLFKVIIPRRQFGLKYDVIKVRAYGQQLMDTDLHPGDLVEVRGQMRSGHRLDYNTGNYIPDFYIAATRIKVIEMNSQENINEITVDDFNRFADF